MSEFYVLISTYILGYYAVLGESLFRQSTSLLIHASSDLKQLCELLTMINDELKPHNCSRNFHDIVIIILKVYIHMMKEYKTLLLNFMI